MLVYLVEFIVHMSINIAEGMPIQLHADWARLGVSAVLGLLRNIAGGQQVVCHLTKNQSRPAMRR